MCVRAEAVRLDELSILTECVYGQKQLILSKQLLQNMNKFHYLCGAEVWMAGLCDAGNVLDLGGSDPQLVSLSTAV